MCGCMLMHGTMDHDGQPGSNPQTGIASPAPLTAKSEGTCAHCDYPLRVGYSFCPNCGMSLQAARCPACGQRTNDSWNACAYCGSPLGEKQANVSR
jgi:predicted amidophosphoribosyltransferase